jgi:cytochrome b561
MTARKSYTAVARWLHWTIAVMILSNIVLGLFHDGLGHVIPAMPLHKAIGITVLALTLVRVLWRITHAPPPLPAAMPGWEKAAAHGLHLVFYGLMVLLPVTGWVMVSANAYPLRWFGLFDIPKFAASKGDAAVVVSHGVHGPLGLIFGALIALHVGAALRHHLVLKDDVLRRMLG